MDTRLEVGVGLAAFAGWPVPEHSRRPSRGPIGTTTFVDVRAIGEKERRREATEYAFESFFPRARADLANADFRVGA